MNKSSILIASALGYCAACGLPVILAAADPPPAHITAAVTTVARTLGEKSRDPINKPAEVLTFAGVKPGDAVVDFVPGDGYWTRLLSQAVGKQGHVYSLVPLRGWMNIETQRKNEADMRAAGKVPPLNPIDLVLPIQAISAYKNVMAIVEPVDWYGGDFGIPRQADVIFNANSYHDLHNKVEGPWKPEPMDMVAIDKAIYRAMKPGAVYVIEDYTAAPLAIFSATEKLKRTEPAAVKAELELAGFVYEGESKVLANPDDDHNRLPTDPALNGKPDRFVLKFRKPRTASSADKRPGPELLARLAGNTVTLGRTENFGTSMFYHADGTLQETSGNPDAGMIESSFYWDADGHNCQYHEGPFTSLGFVACHPMPKLSDAKFGESWLVFQGRQGSQGNFDGLLKGQIYPKPRAGRGGAAGPGGPPAATPPAAQ